MSLLGEPLFFLGLPEETRRDRAEKLAAALAEVERAPEDLGARVWLGRRTAYVGRYRDAIRIFGEGLALAETKGDLPATVRFLRHRGHRYVTVRDFDSAIADLERARALLDRVPEEVEPDGIPNARNVPTSTLHGNVWYHLGLARFLTGRFEEAANAYRASLATARNPDMLCAASHWLYASLRRLGRDAEAARLLEPIRADLDVVENHAYHRLLLAYRGGSAAMEALLAESRGAGGVDFATAGFGAGHWRLVEGDEPGAHAIFEEIVARREWAAFGSIAAEAEIARRRRRS